MLFHEILGYFNGSRSAYRQFVEEALSSPEKPLEKGKGHGIIGNPDFIKGLLKEIPVRPGREQPSARKVISRVEAERVLQAVAKRFRVTSEDIMKKNYKGPARSIAMELLYRHAGINQREIGELMGVDYSTISVARKRLQNSLDQDQKLKKHVTSLERMLNQE